MKRKPTDFTGWKPKETKTEIWKNFVISPDRNWAKCVRCTSVLSVLGGSTKGLHHHEITHKSKSVIKSSSVSSSIGSRSTNTLSTTVDLDSVAGESCNVAGFFHSSCKKQKLITDFTDCDSSMETMIARMIAKDGFCIEKFITCQDLRNLFNYRGFTLPTSANTIRQIVFKKVGNIKQIYKSNIANLIKNGNRFSICVDEWTSLKGKRYMNVILNHLEGFFNLGLVRLHGCADADAISEAIKQRLNDFDITVDNHIIALVSDGAAVMICVGNKLNIEHQVCLAHGFHLAVIKSLYRTSSADKSKCSESREFMSMNVDENTDDSSEESSGEVFIISEESGSQFISQDTAEIKFDNYLAIIKKVRRIVTAFKRSPVLRETHLTPYTNLMPLLDCNTRWNSLLVMVERFLEIIIPIRKALIELTYLPSIHDSDVLLLRKMVTILKPIKLAVDAIARRDANLLSSDAAVRFMIMKLQKFEDPLAISLLDNMQHYVMGRRNDTIVEVMQFFRNPNKGISGSSCKLLIQLAKRLNLSESDSSTQTSLAENKSNKPENDRDTNQSSSSTCDKSDLPASDLAAELNNFILNSVDNAFPKYIPTCSGEKMLRKEIDNYKECGIKGKIINSLENCLLAIKPTSVEAERSFSNAQQLCTKLRTNMSDQMIDSLSFLRSYYQTAASG